MPRTCQWPTNPDNGVPGPHAATGADNPLCGTPTPSYQATDPHDTAGDFDVCDVHKPQAEAAGYKVEPYTARRRSRATATPDLTGAGIIDNPGPEETIPEDPAPRLSIDPRTELDAMATIVSVLDDFGTDAQQRILTWAADFYGAPI